MAEHETLPALVVEAWATMLETALRAGLLFTYVSLPIVLAVVILSPDTLGFLIIALGAQVMMTAAFALKTDPDYRKPSEEDSESIQLSHLLLGALLIGGSAQLVILGVPILAAIYGGPTAGLLAAIAFPFIDGKLNQWYKWLSPSAVMRYVTFRVLVAISSGDLPRLETLESGIGVGVWERH